MCHHKHTCCAVLCCAAVWCAWFLVQMGLNGVDNGQIWFDNVRVPRDAMLDR